LRIAYNSTTVKYDKEHHNMQDQKVSELEMGPRVDTPVSSKDQKTDVIPSVPLLLRRMLSSVRSQQMGQIIEV